MLSNHPQSRFIFQASGIESKIRTEILEMKSAKGSAELIGRQEHVLLFLLPQLHDLNANHFNNSTAITQTLNALGDAVGKLDHDAAWDAFLNLAERPGNNFGTWAI